MFILLVQVEVKADSDLGGGGGGNAPRNRRLTERKGRLPPFLIMMLIGLLRDWYHWPGLVRMAISRTGRISGSHWPASTQALQKYLPEASGTMLTSQFGSFSSVNLTLASSASLGPRCGIQD